MPNRNNFTSELRLLDYIVYAIKFWIEHDYSYIYYILFIFIYSINIV